eukprot:gene33725-43288_t
MVKLWTRLLMGLVFVFVTISSPLHARTIHPEMTAHTFAISSTMDADCARAMAAQHTAPQFKSLAKSLAKSPAQTDGGCCTDGCNCPLSHCPATEAVIVEALPVVFAAHASPIPIADRLPARRFSLLSLKDHYHETLTIMGLRHGGHGMCALA